MLCNFHLSFPDVLQGNQRFKFTRGTHQRMESQISWTAMYLGSIHLRLTLTWWRMTRRCRWRDQTCLSARTGLSIFWCTRTSLPAQAWSTAVLWIMFLSLSLWKSNGVSFQVLSLAADGCVWVETQQHKAASMFLKKCRLGLSENIIKALISGTFCDASAQHGPGNGSFPEATVGISNSTCTNAYSLPAFLSYWLP